MNVEPEDLKGIKFMNCSTKELDGVVPLGSELCNIKGVNLPANLPYNTDLLHVSIDHLEREVQEHSILHVETGDSVYVDLLEDSFNALNEYAFILAHLEIASSEVAKYNSTHIDTNRGIYKLNCVGRISPGQVKHTYLTERLREFRPIKPKDINKPFTLLGMEVLFNEDPETRENRAFKLTNGYLLPTYQDASTLEIACSLMSYMTGMYKETLSKVYQEEK